MALKRRSRLFSFVLIFSFFLVSCAFYQEGGETSQAPDMRMEMDDMPSEMAEDSLQDVEQTAPESDLDIGEKVIETASLDFETTHFDDSLEFVNRTISEFDATIQHSSRGQSTSSYGYVGDYISMTIRVPQDNLPSFVDVLNEFERFYIQHQEIGRQDVTRTYRDNETRIEILREEEAVLRQMLEEQGSLEEILQIRTRLSEVVAEREILENQNRNYDQQIDYSTVYLTIQQTDRVNQQDVSGFWDRLGNAFIDSFYRFVAVLQNLVITFVYLFPFIIILGVIAYIVYRIYQARRQDKL